MAPTSYFAPKCAWTTPKVGVAFSPVNSDGEFESTRHLGSTNRVQQRFIAGDTFFNYDAYGSLRPLEDPIRLWSRLYFGLAVHAALCGFIYYFFSNGYGEVLAVYLKANSDRQVLAARYLLTWPNALSIFIGFVSDSFPLFGYRRKSYMVLGLVISIVAYALAAFIDTYGHSRDHLLAQASLSRSEYPVAYLAVSLVASIGIQISWVSSLILGVEYAQRETLLHRGGLMATLIALFYFGGLVAFATIAQMRSSDSSSSVNHVLNISFGGAAAVLACVSSIAIPFVLWGLKEEKLEYQLVVGGVKSITLGERLSHLWKFCHHNIFYRIVFFIGLHMFLASLYDQNVKDATLYWSHVSQSDFDIVQAARMGAQVVGTWLWGVYLRNVSWQKLALFGTVFFMALRATFTICTLLDLIRSKWFYGVMIVAADIPSAWLVLYGAVLATEIAEVGHEGVIFALGFSFQALASLSSYTLATTLPNVFGLGVSRYEIALDQTSTRLDLVKSTCILLAFNLSSLVFIRLLPQQKLDAQQLRAFGGYNKCAGVTLAATFVAMLVSNFVANLVDVLV